MTRETVATETCAISAISFIVVDILNITPFSDQCLYHNDNIDEPKNPFLKNM